ncbi:MAG: MarC family protein [Flavobacteriaceae bacterium]|jgi:multiple antibiotic resistance protein|nr:MarC family protein [Flavobacteriaceae bacterium]
MLHTFATEFLGALIALFPIVNPIGSAFIVNNFFEGLDNHRRRSIIKQIGIYCLCIGIGSLLAGRFILILFGLSIPVIQLGGGLIICRTALNMLSDESSKNKANRKMDTMNKMDYDGLEHQIFYPITFPLIMGSGAISVIFTLAANALYDDFLHTVTSYLTIAAAIVVICLLVYIFLLNSSKIVNRLGYSANIIINKLLAFFTFCIGLQIAVTGISKIFHWDLL